MNENRERIVTVRFINEISDLIHVLENPLYSNERWVLEALKEGVLHLLKVELRRLQIVKQQEDISLSWRS